MIHSCFYNPWYGGSQFFTQNAGTRQKIVCFDWIEWVLDIVYQWGLSNPVLFFILFHIAILLVRAFFLLFFFPSSICYLRCKNNYKNRWVNLVKNENFHLVQSNDPIAERSSRLYEIHSQKSQSLEVNRRVL